MKNMIVVLALAFTSSLAQAYDYICYNENNLNRSGTAEGATFKALLHIEQGRAVLKVLENADTAPKNWKLNAGVTYSFSEQKPLNPDYLNFATADGRADLNVKKYDLGMNSVRVAWGVTAIPRTHDDPAYGTGGGLRCWEK